MKLNWPTRGWFRYSLRTLLVLVALCAIPCSWLAVKLRQSEREAAAAAVVKSWNATVEWDDTEYPRLSAWLSGHLGEHCLGHVKTIWLPVFYSSDLPQDLRFDITLEPLDSLNHLEELGLGRTNCNDSLLEHLHGLRGLKRLCLDCTNVTDAGLEKIAALGQLEEVSLVGTKVTDASLEHFQRMKQLKSVVLTSTQVTDAGVAKLRQALPDCEVVYR